MTQTNIRVMKNKTIPNTPWSTDKYHNSVDMANIKRVVIHIIEFICTHVLHNDIYFHYLVLYNILI
jgi:hypothetical protein